MVPHSVEKSQCATHLLYKLSNMPTTVNNGDVEVLKVEMEEGIKTLRVF
jgi:hypothetical protein